MVFTIITWLQKSIVMGNNKNVNSFAIRTFSLESGVYCLFRYLTGNPCTDYDGYREFVVGTLPQIDTLDGIEVTHYDKLVAKQLLPNVKPKIIAQQNAYESNIRLNVFFFFALSYR